MWVYERKLAQSKVTKRWSPINCKQLKDHKFLQPTFFTQNLSFSSHSWILLLGVYYSWHVCQIQLNFWWTKTKSAFLCTDHHRSVSLEKPVCRKRFRLTRPTKCPFSTANANNLSDFRLFVQNACENVSFQQTRTICPFLVCAKRLRKRRSSTKICYLRLSSPPKVNHEKECRVRNNFLCTPVWVEGCLLGCLVCARAMARKNWKARKGKISIPAFASDSKGRECVWESIMERECEIEKERERVCEKERKRNKRRLNRDRESEWERERERERCLSLHLFHLYFYFLLFNQTRSMEVILVKGIRNQDLSVINLSFWPPRDAKVQNRWKNCTKIMLLENSVWPDG